LRLRWSL